MPGVKKSSKTSLEKRLPKLLARARLRPGSQGPAVVMLQDYLLKHGFLAPTPKERLTADSRLEHAQLMEVFTTAVGRATESMEHVLDTARGKFDGHTLEALKAFQAFHGLEPTGRIDDQTVELLSLPRYDPHPDQPLFVVAAPWDHMDLTYTFLNSSSRMPELATHAVIRRAFDTWQAASKLTFTLAHADQTPDIKIMWATGDHGDGTKFDGPLGILAHSDFPAPRGKDPGILHFDDDEAWVDDPHASLAKKDIDLLTIAAHEIGHCIGLDHSQDREALMYAVYSAPRRDENKQDLGKLAQDDVDGVSALYP